MASEKVLIKGFNEGISGIPEWFNQFDGFTYDDSQDIFSNFEHLMEHHKLNIRDSKSRAYLVSLQHVVKQSHTRYPSMSEANRIAQSLFSKRFPGVAFKSSESLSQNVARLIEHARWPEWDKQYPNPERTLRNAIAKKIFKEWLLKIPQPDEEQAMKSAKPDPVPSFKVQIPVYSPSQAISFDEIEQLLEKEAAGFFSKYKGFGYRPSQSVSDNFLRFAKSKGLNPGPSVNGYLHPLLVRAVDAMEPKPIDRVFDKDYAKTYFAKFQDFTRVPGLTSFEEWERLREHKTWTAMNKSGTQLDILKQTLSGRIAADLVNRLHESLTLSAMKDAGKIVSLPKTSAKQPVVATETVIIPNKNLPKDKKNGGDAASFQRYFDQYPHFTREPTESLMVEFERLAISQDWKKGSKAYRKERERFLSDQFEEEWSEIMYTRDESDDEGGDDDAFGGGVPINKAFKLAQWQNLCHEVGIDPVPSSATQCKKALGKVYVNIVDLLDVRRKNQHGQNEVVTVRKFATQNALAKYTRDSNKVFPKKQAKRDGALKALLVHVFGHGGKSRAG